MKKLLLLMLVSGVLPTLVTADCGNGRNSLLTPKFIAWVESHTLSQDVLLLGDSIMVGISRLGVKRETLNAEMGANRIQDMIYTLEHVRLPADTLKFVVIGSAGINNEMSCEGQSPQHFDRLLGLIHSRYPLARVVSFGIPPNTGGRFAAVLKHRDRINRYVRENVDCYIDTDVLFGAKNGIADRSYFLDGLHFTPGTARMVKDAIRSQCDVEI